MNFFIIIFEQKDKKEGYYAIFGKIKSTKG